MALNLNFPQGRIGRLGLISLVLFILTIPLGNWVVTMSGSSATRTARVLFLFGPAFGRLRP